MHTKSLMQGFTLIELMIVAAIIDILSAVPIAAYQTPRSEGPSLLGGHAAMRL
ncbi:MAG: prepilin-type N-terminal cleavage/methylation domain-containing protein [Rhodocyclaceae bacterium]|nr:prepilin-type N-terminal cleavage/methylation domain-containing protein [Rhodocyclaceae bacterium]MCA3023680.1 prepilin-type N-terminal cleavage/methylation domain-containing protein [Rhodocyclaceae bacterium]MCA3030335.1 prepilin-type N-terminal cleavage/methylation domain-containing protein [Rhodocyclaceae bacterium]MCA3035667.1 prepilin-type N-terminal cleavage/methylation domain-containing protein [Rhodocyclaceae bacterium]MCA3040091.1 prepilin-type N-terminal cleavage/methylation domain